MSFLKLLCVAQDMPEHVTLKKNTVYFCRLEPNLHGVPSEKADSKWLWLLTGWI